MGLLNWIRQKWNAWKNNHISERIIIARHPEEPIEANPFPKEWQPDEKIVMSIRRTDNYEPNNAVIKHIRQSQIRQTNQKRRTKFSNAEHFKQRQPTTARMLWKPNAKIKDEEEENA
jgi:hypothetical protein